MSSISGVVKRPSGRTVTDVESSGLRHTKMLRESSGPTTYSAPGPSSEAWNCAGGKVGSPLFEAQAESARAVARAGTTTLKDFAI